MRKVLKFSILLVTIGWIFHWNTTRNLDGIYNHYSTAAQNEVILIIKCCCSNIKKCRCSEKICSVTNIISFALQTTNYDANY